MNYKNYEKKRKLIVRVVAIVVVALMIGSVVLSATIIR